jgi:alanine-glyoxylate transaminase/serine-glyoxylate transaminase/serine-pyruvate transaminase
MPARMTLPMSIPQPRIPGRRFLHSPGPTPLPDAVLHAMAQQPMDLGDARVDANIAACEAGLRRLLNSPSADVFFVAANGHGAWESVVENAANLGATVLVAGTGHFSESWAAQTEAPGRRVLRTPWLEGWPIAADAIEQVLRDDRAHRVQAIFAVHTDTASSLTSDVAAIRRAIDAARHPALLVVDVVASAAAAPFEMDALGADVAMGASQKGLMCPAGLGWVAVNDRAFSVAQANPAPRSVSVTSITVPQGTDVKALRSVARERFQVSVAGGPGPLAGRAFRIGVQGIPVGDGVTCAVQHPGPGGVA